jgi:hypothetical protein
VIGGGARFRVLIIDTRDSSQTATTNRRTDVNLAQLVIAEDFAWTGPRIQEREFHNLLRHRQL